MSGGLGCLAFLLGAILAIVLFAPQLLSTYGARVLTTAIEARIEGRAEVQDVRLSWSGPQRAETVTVYTAEGDRLLEGSVEFPSILELLADEGRRGRIHVHVRELRSTLDGSGRGGLARTLAAAPRGTGRAPALDGARDVLDWLRERPGLGERERQIDFTAAVDRAVFEGDPDRGEAPEVTITALDVVGRVDGDRLVLDVETCEIVAHEIPAASGVARARGRLDLVAGELPERLDVEAGPLPLSVLRTLGLAPGPGASAGPGAPVRGDLFDAAARGLIAFAGGIAAGGVELERLRLVRDPDDPEPGSALEFRARGSFGQVELRGRLVDTGEAYELTPPRVAAEGFPLTMQWTSTDPAGPARWIEPLLPEGLRIDGGGRAASLRAFASTFRLRWSAMDRPGGVEQALAASLRRGDLLLKLAEGAGGNTVGVVASPGDGDPTAEAWRLEHRVTEIRLMGDMGGSVETFWLGSDGGQSVAQIRIPGAALPGGDAPGSVAVDLKLRGIPTWLLESWATWPPSVGALLPSRVPRLEIAGIPVEHWLDPEPLRRYELDIDLELEPGRRFSATLREELFETDGGLLSLPASDELVGHLLLAPMPWLEACRLARDGDPGQGTVTVAIEGLRFDALEGEELAAERISIALPPLEVRLCRSLEREILGARGKWLRWTPGRVEYSLDRGRAAFDAVELPLGTEESALMTGSSEDGTFDLTGPVELRFLPVSADVTGGVVESLQVSFRGDDQEVTRAVVLPSLKDLDLKALGLGR